MAKALRFSAIALALVLAGVVGLAWFLANTDFDRYRGEVAAWLSHETGFEVRIDGSLSVRHALRHGLWPQLSVEGLSVWTQVDGDRQLLAKVQELDLVANPFDSLFGGLRIDHVVLQGAEILLVRDASGNDSWMTGNGDRSGRGIDLVVKRASVENSSITYRNELADAQTRLDLEQLEWSAENAWEPGKLQLRGELSGLPLSVEASLSGEDHRGGEPHHYAVQLRGELLGAKVEAEGSVAGLNLRDTKLALDLRAPSLAGLARLAALEEVDLPAVGPVAASATLQGVKGVLGLQDIDLRIGDRKRAWLEAKGAAHNLEGAREVHLDLDFGTLDLRHLSPWLKEAPLELDSFTGSGSLSDKDGSLGLEALVLKAGREEILDLHVEGQIDDLRGFGELELNVKLKARYLGDLGSLVFTPFPLAGPLSLTGNFVGARARASMRNLSMTLGESAVTGSVVYRNPVGTRPMVEARLQSALMRIEDLGIFPGALERAEQETVPGTAADDPIPFERLDLFDADLNLDVAKLLGRAGFDVEQLSAQARLRQGQLDVSRFGLEFRGGHFDLQLQIDARSDPPAVVLLGEGRGLHMERLLAQFERQDALSGRGDLSLDLRSSGRSRRELEASLHGSMVALVNEGRIDSAWANAMVRDATRALFSSSWKRGDQVFDCLATSLTASDGVIPHALILLDAEQTRIVGRGSIDLRNETLDLEFTPHPRDPGLLSLAAQVRVRGPFADPRVSTNALSVPASAGTTLFRNAFRLSGASTLASLALPRDSEPSACDGLREELKRARAGG